MATPQRVYPRGRRSTSVRGGFQARKRRTIQAPRPAQIKRPGPQVTGNVRSLPAHMRGIDMSRLNAAGRQVVSEAARRPIVSNAIPRQSDVVKAIGDALRNPMARTTAIAGTTHNLGLNIKQQMANLKASQARRERDQQRQATIDKFKYGRQQVGRIVARRRGTPTGSGGPSFVRGRRQ